MAYIGKQPTIGNFVKLDAITTSATTTFNLTNGGVAYSPQSPNHCIVSLNGVIQSPTSAYTISGSTIVFSDALTSSDTIDFILVLGDVLNIGTPSDNTVSLTKLTATGTKDATTFLRGDNTFATVTADGTADWDTSVKTTGFTATANKGYFCNTTSAAFTVTLPATPSAGDEVIILDYAGTFDTNALVISPNGGKIEGATANLQLSGEREGVRLVYIDSTQGWLAYSGINEGTDALSPAPYSIDFLVIAGGGGGTFGGGGAGGYRTSTQTVTAGTVITVTVGDGGAYTTSGSNSSISGSGLTTITSTGGGYGGGGGGSNVGNGGNGGSGGGAGHGSGDSAGTGNTPSTSPSQGNSGGISNNQGSPNHGGGGGGGAGAVGGIATGAEPTSGGSGGAGTASSITGSSVTRAGGGGGAYATAAAPNGGSGGGGSGGSFYFTPSFTSTAGTANTGGGGGGDNSQGAAGGKGVVILSMPISSYSGTTTGSPTVTESGANKILQFNGSGSYTT